MSKKKNNKKKNSCLANHKLKNYLQKFKSSISYFEVQCTYIYFRVYKNKNLIFCANVNFDFSEYEKKIYNKRTTKKKKMNKRTRGQLVSQGKQFNIFFFVMFELLDVVVFIKICLFKDRSRTIVDVIFFYHF